MLKKLILNLGNARVFAWTLWLYVLGVLLLMGALLAGWSGMIPDAFLSVLTSLGGFALLFLWSVLWTPVLIVMAVMSFLRYCIDPDYRQQHKADIKMRPALYFWGFGWEDPDTFFEILGHKFPEDKE